MSDRARIGYLVKEFPVVSETFILNEVRALERHDVPLELLSLKRSATAVVHPGLDEVTVPVRRAPWLRPIAWPRHVVDHLTLALSRYRRYFRTVRRALSPALGRWLRRPSRAGATTLRKQMRRLSWAVWVAGVARRRNVCHLHAHYAGEPLRVAHLVHRLTALPYSFTAHAKDLYLAPRRRLARRLRSAEFAVGCHRHGVETMRSLLPEADASKVLYVRHGTDTELFANDVRAPHPHRLLAVGRLTEKKAFDVLIDACALLRGVYPQLRCDLLGDGRLRGELERRIDAANLGDCVRIRGFQPQDRLVDWYRKAAIVVLPFRVLDNGNRDGIPNVLLEAMATGAPVVATSAAGVREWIRDGVNGLLATPGDARDLAVNLARLLEDPHEAERLGRKAAAAVSNAHFEVTNRPLARRLLRELERPVAAALDAADDSAWGGRGMARKARKLLGRRPARHSAGEAGIRSAIRPGLLANVWRPDLERLASRRLWDEVVKARRLPRLLPLLTAGSRSGSILDLGCGRGGLTVALQAAGFTTAAVDLRFRNCAVTRWRSRRYGLPAGATTGLAEALPFADDSFDAVACLEVLEHVHDPAALLREIGRVLRPGGRCAITVINRWAHFDPHYHLWGVNFLPRRWARRYIALRRRTKRSYRDLQTLDEMHYYSLGNFVDFAGRHGFRVLAPAAGQGLWSRLQHALRLRLSLGFNSLTVVLVPERASQPAEARTAGDSAIAAVRGRLSPQG